MTAVTPYFCATHSVNDPNVAPCLNLTGGGAGSWSAPLGPAVGGVQPMVRRANGKPLLEGYCSAWQPSPFALTTNAITPSALFPSAPNANPAGIGAGIQVVKTFPDEAEALVSLPTFPNPYNADPATNKSPVLVMVPWLPQQEGVGYPVATNGSEDIFVQTAQLDFTGQVITPTMDFFPVNPTGVPLPATASPPYNVSVAAWETQDFLGDVFLCVDYVSSANNAGNNSGAAWVPGDMLSAHMYSSAETIVELAGGPPGRAEPVQHHRALQPVRQLPRLHHFAQRRYPPRYRTRRGLRARR